MYPTLELREVSCPVAESPASGVCDIMTGVRRDSQWRGCDADDVRSAMTSRQVCGEVTNGVAAMRVTSRQLDTRQPITAREQRAMQQGKRGGGGDA